MVGITYGVIKVIGFPLPFTILTVSPMWLLLTSTAMAFEWTHKLRDNPAATKMVLGMIKLWLCDTLLVFIYPIYFYIFTTLSNDGQTAFSMLLPVIKLSMRNLFARMADHLKDEAPEIVVFNAELFNSLFVSYCMQNSPSFMTTLLMTIANVVTMALSLRDINHARRGLKMIERQIDEEKRRSSLGGHISYNVTGGRPLTTLERICALLQQDDIQARTRTTSLAEILHIASYSNATVDLTQKIQAESGSSPRVMPKRVFSPSARSQRYLGQSQSRAVVHPTVDESKPVEDDLASVPYTIRYTCKVQRLLYMAEFLILLKYVEVVIPLVFTVYLMITYRLPNRDYYAIFDGMDEVQLIQTLTNVMFYCSLQLASLLLLIFTLKRMLDLPPTRQLAFVLEKQFHWVQISLVFWVFYNVQASLKHCGYDYSFQFSWLRTGSV